MRDRLSIAIYCDWCGASNEHGRKITPAPAPSPSHICSFCARDLATPHSVEIIRLRASALLIEINRMAVDISALRARRNEVSELFFACNRAFAGIQTALKGLEGTK